jgi:hypothetical protein
MEINREKLSKKEIGGEENEKAIRRNRYRERFSPYDYPG